MWCCRNCSESEDIDWVLISQKTHRYLEFNNNILVLKGML